MHVKQDRENYQKYVSFIFAEPVTEIIGGSEIFVDRGSTLNVTCAVAAGSKEPGFIFWSRNDKVSRK